MGRVTMAGWLALALVLFAGKVQAVTPSKAKVHGFALSGAITSVDEAKKTLVVKSAAGKLTTLRWTDATSVFDGKLAVGQAVTLRYLDRDGKHIATSIRITPARTPTASVDPTPLPASR